MKLTTAPNDDRLQQLLADEATEGLDRSRRRELNELLADHPHVDRHGLECAAAALTLAIGGVRHVILPAEMKQRLVQEGRLMLADVPRPAQNYAAWWLVAAVGVVALLGWTRDRLPDSGLSPSQQMAALLRDADDVVRAPWQGQTDAFAAVSGEVIWSDTTQRGYMVLRDLPSSAERQYQLWIVDPNRDSRPVDGGVFDMPDAAGEVVVAIDAKLEVQTPQAFAITLEQAGGVVVSDGPLLVVASVGS